MSLHCKIVDQNEFAFTARCTRSGQLQLAFGNIALLMNPQEFTGLLEQVSYSLEQVSPDRCPYCRNIVIDTSVSKMAFIFSRQDLVLLHEVMQRTSVLLEAEHILRHTE